MSSSTPEATTVRCAYPGCENEPRAAEDVVGAKPKYCGQPDPLTGKPHGALTAFRRRQEPPAEAEAEQPVTMARAGGELRGIGRHSRHSKPPTAERLTGPPTPRRPR